MEKFKEMVILIAEDDDGHVELITSGLKTAGVLNKIIRFSNGEEIWNFFIGKHDEVNFDNTKNYEDGCESVEVEVINDEIVYSSHELTGLDKKCILIKIEDKEII